jgi:hypothetical protein
MKRGILLGLIALLVGAWIHGSPPAGSITTTFDPSQTDPRTTLSGGDLISTSNTSGGSAYFVSRSVANNSTGQFYNELTFNSIGSCVSACTGQIVFGIGDGNAAAELGLNADSIGMFDNGGFYLNSVQTGPAQQTLSVGSTAGIAVDFTAKLIWMELHGSPNWNNTSGCTPANAGCGISIAGLNAGPYYFYASTHDVSGVQLTANFGATAYADAAPAGFANWTNPGNGGGNTPYVFNPNAVKAQPLINTLGVNTHLTQVGTPYSTVSNVSTDMAYLGISLIRDYGLDTLNPNQASPIAATSAIAPIATESLTATDARCHGAEVRAPEAGRLSETGYVCRVAQYAMRQFLIRPSPRVAVAVKSSLRCRASIFLAKTSFDQYTLKAYIFGHAL